MGIMLLVVLHQPARGVHKIFYGTMLIRSVESRYKPAGGLTVKQG